MKIIKARLTSSRLLIIRWVLAMSALTFLSFVAFLFITVRAEPIKRAIVETLSEHLNLDVTMDALDVGILPVVRLSGDGLTMRVRNRPDLPPFISIKHFSVRVGVLTMLRAHVDEVRLTGLQIHVPPKAARATVGEQQTASTTPTLISKASAVVVDRLVSHDAELVFVPRKAGKEPLTFPISDLHIDGLGFERVMAFHATLTNPKPTGLIDATGTFGPWQKDDIASMNVAGDYTFSDADLDSLNGLGGMLTSTGHFEGPITEIAVDGESSTPNFSLDIGGAPVPLSTKFQTTVDGTDATTVLKRVEALLGKTTIVVNGSIDNLPGPGRHPIVLDAEVASGYVQDLLRLAIDDPTPMMTGRVSLQLKLNLPPGPPKRARDRLNLSGSFGLAGTRFTDKSAQDKVEGLSRRSQGKDQDAEMERVVSNIKGKFELAGGVLHLADVAFEVPGASVTLAGTYTIDGGALDMHGALRMQATVSKAMGGKKSIFLKLFDPLFKRNGAGAVLPIKITGTIKDPQPSIEIGKALRRKG